ncbi:MAG: hypothetical protein K6G72_06760, partial [Lachnospiraceae bacterium]|nr:hypothetical protein [Lachnospiraceae bacterium]
ISLNRKRGIEMKANTVLVDINEVKVDLWNRLREVAADDKATVKDLLVELRGQIILIDELEGVKDI